MIGSILQLLGYLVNQAVLLCTLHLECFGRLAAAVSSLHFAESTASFGLSFSCSRYLSLQLLFVIPITSDISSTCTHQALSAGLNGPCLEVDSSLQGTQKQNVALRHCSMQKCSTAHCCSIINGLQVWRQPQELTGRYNSRIEKVLKHQLTNRQLLQEALHCISNLMPPNR